MQCLFAGIQETFGSSFTVADGICRHARLRRGGGAAPHARASASLAKFKKKPLQGRRLPKEKPTWRIRDRLSAFQVTTMYRCESMYGYRSTYSMRQPLPISRPLLKKPVGGKQFLGSSVDTAKIDSRLLAFSVDATE
ncbi:hypothetical protein THAOC_04042 [Thalassiosira oceanica]|uniref:Uncharacterized protein n=1 Tax=Thalassiosira oceanica TaxID=159749 RepID=K0TB11_THAOC|nr:hypothetical protein THAOC_04042 [Thalassiosira oceanica]|eukprot:EJK74294.1 hypothetical protein THAOC_04042 [Thalassiosira oceanica]